MKTSKTANSAFKIQPVFVRYLCVYMSLKSIVLYTTLFMCTIAKAQSTDERLAAQFYDNQEYIKAESIYKKLFKKHPSSVYIYENYLNTLIALKYEKEATRMVQKQVKRYPSQVNYQVDEGYVLLQFDKKDKAEKHFDKLTRTYSDYPETLKFLAQCFDRRGLRSFGILALERGVKKRGIIALYEDLSQAYKAAGQTKNLIDITMKALLADAKVFDYATSIIDIAFDKQEDANYLQSQALTYAQKNPSNQVFDELLVEVFLQQKKYKSALRQVISLDKRNKTKGSRVMQLARLCVNNQAYDVAIDAYSYVVELGKYERNYHNAQNGLVDALYLKTTQAINPHQQEITSLITKIQDYVGDKGISQETASSQYRLAELHIFYNNNVPAGVGILEEIIRTPRLRASFMAKSKLLLGDAYLILNNIWDAKLMYGQVDKQFKEDALGQEAKFKNAKLSYYRGEFEWAKGQLDILKTATTQLISNNAIELALLIQDNTGLDSTEDAMKEYAAAEFYLYKNDVAKCTEILNMLPFKYPNHTLNDEIYYLKAKVQEKIGNYEAANTLYTSIYEKHGEDILADNALYRSANITLFILQDREKAQSLYEKLILEYNSSLFAVDARKMYFALKDGEDVDGTSFNTLQN